MLQGTQKEENNCNHVFTINLLHLPRSGGMKLDKNWSRGLISLRSQAGRTVLTLNNYILWPLRWPLASSVGPPLKSSVLIL